MTPLDAERLLTRVGQHMWGDIARRRATMQPSEYRAINEAIERVWELKREIRRELQENGQ